MKIDYKKIYDKFIARQQQRLDEAKREREIVKGWISVKLHRSQLNQHLKTNGKIIEMISGGVLNDHTQAKGIYWFWHRHDNFVANIGQGVLYDRMMYCFRQVETGPKSYPNSSGGYQAAVHMREYDPNPDNWMAQYRIVETDSQELREEIELELQKKYQPRFNRFKGKIKVATPHKGEC